jgi:hypothetical protein
LRAMEAKQFEAAVAAIKEKGILSGLRVEQKQVPGCPDTDTLGLDRRRDECHFSDEGLSRAAELWLSTLVANRS